MARNLRPVELPDIVKMIIARIPFEERARARQINRTWNASVTYSVAEKQTLLKRGLKRHLKGDRNLLKAIDGLLQDPRVDPSVHDNEAIRAASRCYCPSVFNQ